MNAPRDKDARVPRELEAREQLIRQETWAPPEILPTPDPKEGYSFWWVRTELLGKDDAMNVSSKMREGFRPVPASEQPRLAAGGDSGGNVIYGGLMLFQIPTEMLRQRTAYYAQVTRNAQQAVDSSLMRESDPRMPLFKEGKTKVSFGSGGE